jgi:hypothetical protein
MLSWHLYAVFKQAPQALRGADEGVTKQVSYSIACEIAIWKNIF